MNRREFLVTTAAPLTMQGQGAGERLQGRELFVDTEWIDSLQGATLRMHAPVDRGPAFQLDRSWEGAFSAYFTMLKLDSGFRAYYRGVPNSGADGRGDEVTCYAESRDGIVWTKPDQNVIVREQPPFSHNFTPFIDPRPGVPENERFKALAGTSRSGLMAFASADGLRWRRWRETPVLPPSKVTRYDSQNLAFWSASEGRFVLYFRTFKDVPGKGRVRWVSRTTSDDFANWAEPVEMRFFTRTRQPAPPDHLYTNQTSAYFRAPHIYVAIAARFLPGRQVLTPEEAHAIRVDPGYFKDTSDAIMMTTRGGDTYQRTFLETFLRPGLGMENWVSRTNYPALNLLQTGPGEMSLYVNRNYGQPTAHLARYSLRLDGLASLHAGYEGGEMTTRPFLFTGSALDINYSTSAAGSVRVQVEDARGGAIEGFRFEDCREIIGDQISRKVTWGAANLASLQNRTVRLRFKLHDADLFSWQVA
ncbi:MAG: hypothetical protein JNN08_13285 [Bryobacterales bacterium]|nr:hypothetical protein [Bryobacterales bacterium]